MLFAGLAFQPLKSNKKLGSTEDEIEGELCLSSYEKVLHTMLLTELKLCLSGKK